MTYIGLTPMSHISIAEITGIQQFENVIRADLASVKTGAAISATTAGRMPLKHDATHPTS